MTIYEQKGFLVTIVGLGKHLQSYVYSWWVIIHTILVGKHAQYQSSWSLYYFLTCVFSVQDISVIFGFFQEIREIPNYFRDFMKSLSELGISRSD